VLKFVAKESLDDNLKPFWVAYLRLY
jgi:hypothetical protein